MALGILFIIIVVLFVFIFIGIYNRLVALRKRCDNGWAQIDVQLKRRYDLIPNLVETAKGYLKHVTKARQQAIDASGVAGQAKAENFLSQTLRSLFAVVENYPDLKANENMKAVQEELVSTENKISYARQHYNDVVMTYNTATETIPSNVVASMFNFVQREFFELEDEAQREAPKVDFS
jgi:LemA protein